MKKKPEGKTSGFQCNFRYNPETTPLINVYYVFGLCAMPEKELSNMLRTYWKSSAAGVMGFFAFAKAALEAKRTAVTDVAMRANAKPIKKLKDDTAKQKKVKKHIERQRIAVGWD